MGVGFVSAILFLRSIDQRCWYVIFIGACRLLTSIYAVVVRDGVLCCLLQGEGDSATEGSLLPVVDHLSVIKSWKENET